MAAPKASGDLDCCLGFVVVGALSVWGAQLSRRLPRSDFTQTQGRDRPASAPCRTPQASRGVPAGRARAPPDCRSLGPVSHL